jgi:putative proteasome-type protease
MTYCLGMRMHSGLVGIADTRITSGQEAITAKKVTIYHGEQSAMFLMTSGLRSVRDKVLTYFEETLEAQTPDFTRLHQAADAFGQQLRKVAAMDKSALEEAGLRFDLHTLIGGQMSQDVEPKLFMV